MAQEAEEQKLFDAAAAWLSYASRVTETAGADVGPQVLPTPEEVVAVSAVPCQANALADFALHQLQADVEQRRMPPFWAQVAECAHTLRSASKEGEGSISESHTDAVDKVGRLLHGALKDLHSVVSGHCIQLSQLSQQLLSQQQDTYTTPHITLYPPTSSSQLPTQPSHSLAALLAPQRPTSSHLTASPQLCQRGAFVFNSPTQRQSDSAGHQQGTESSFSFPSLPFPSTAGQQQQLQQQSQQYGCPSTPPIATKHALSRISEPATPQLLAGFHEALHRQQHPFQQQEHHPGGFEGHGQQQQQQHHYQQQQQQQHQQEHQEQQQQQQQLQEGHHVRAKDTACQQPDDQHHQHHQQQEQQQRYVHQAQAMEPPRQQSDDLPPLQHPGSSSADAPASVGMCALVQLPKVFEVRVSALLLASATCSLAGVLLQYFRARLLQLGHQMAEMEGQLGQDLQGSTAGADVGHQDAQHTPPPPMSMTDASTPSPAAGAAHPGLSQAAGGPWSGVKPTTRQALHVSVGNGGNDAMECDDATAAETSAAAVAADASSPNTAAASMDFDVRSLGAERREAEHAGSGRRGGFKDGRDGGNVRLMTPNTPCTPAAAAVSCLLGRQWEGEVADVASLMAGLGAHAACEEAAAAAVAADVHRRLSELAKGVYDTEVAPQALHYMRCVPAAFLRLVLAGAGATAGTAASAATAHVRACATSSTKIPSVGGCVGAGASGGGGGGGGGGGPARLPPMPTLPSQGLRASLARADTDARMQRAMQEWHLRLMYMTYEALGAMRISEMFEIVVDYPDSHPAVLDMAACLRNTNLHLRFVSSFRVALCSRLLHAGAHARDIVHQYVATIRVLREIDPSGALLAAVASPLRRYLRQRPDTARCVVALVTKGDGDGNPSLLEELQQGATDVGAAGGKDEDDAGTLGDEAALRVLHKACQPPPASAMAPAMSTADWWLQRVGSGAGGTPGGAGTPGSTRTISRMFHQGTPPPHSAASTPHTATPHSQAPLPTPGSAAGLQRVMSPVQGSWYSNPQLHSQQRPGRQQPQQQQQQQQEGVWWDAEGGGGWEAGEAEGGGVDIVALLIGIFGSKDVFVSEYRLRLAQELLALHDYDTTSHLRIMELLKLRFGDTPLHACEVMLKDMADSKRVNANILRALSSQKHNDDSSKPEGVKPMDESHHHHQQQQQQQLQDSKDMPLSATIMSHLFWPPVGGWGDEQGGPSSERAIESCLRVPTQVAEAMEAYAERYTALKAPRKLHWKPHVGCVEMQVAVGDVVVDFCVSPVLASILAPFQHHDALTAEQLAVEVNLPAPLVRRRALFWVNHGILLGTYRRASVLHPSMHGSRVEELGLEEDTPTQLPTAIDSLVLELGPYEPYIMGMLANYGGLPLDRLHAMLKLFVVSPKYDKSTEQLAGFLSHLATQEKLIVDNGVWKKKPAPSKPSEN